MAVAWDTSVVSRMTRDAPAHRAVIEAAEAGNTIALPALVISEVAYGVGKRSSPQLLKGFAWLKELIAAQQLNVLPLTDIAAEVAGRLRSVQPSAPSSARRRATTKPEGRVAWVMDLLIAATAWAHGYELATCDQAHFQIISGLLPSGKGDRVALEIVRPEWA